MTLPITYLSSNRPSDYASNYTLQDAWLRKNLELMREIIKIDPEALYKRDSDSKTIFHRIIDAQDIKAFNAISMFVDRSKMGPAEGVLDDLSINDYVVAHGTIDMLELFVKHQKQHHDQLYFSAVKYRKKDHLEWLVYNEPFEKVDFNAFEMACYNVDSEMAFIIMDLAPKVNDLKVYSKILRLVIEQKSLSFIKAMVTRIECELGHRNYSYFDENEFQVYTAALLTFELAIVEYFMSLTGHKIFLVKKNKWSNLSRLESRNGINFLESLFKNHLNLKAELKYELEELLYSAILNDDCESARTLIDWGVDINATVTLPTTTPLPLICGVFTDSISKKTLSLLIEKKVKIWDEDGPLFNLLSSAIEKGLDEFASYIVDQEQGNNYSYSSEIYLAGHHDSKILDRLFEKNLIYMFKMSETEAKAALLTIVNPPDGITKKNYFDFYVNSLILEKSKFYNSEQYCKDLVYFNREIGKVHKKEVLDYLTSLVFGKGFKVVRPSLLLIPNFFQMLVSDLKTVTYFNSDIYLLALQAYDPDVFDDFSMVKRVSLLHCWQINNRNSILDLSEEQIRGRLEYGALLRSRKINSFNYLLLKQSNLSNSNLKLLLKGIGATGIPHLNQVGKQWLHLRLLEILKRKSDEEVKVEAIKALWLIDKNKNNPFVKEQLLAELEGCTSEKSLVVLIEVLSNYEDKPDFKIAKRLIQLFHSDLSVNLQKSLALALRKIPYKEGLLTALKIVKGAAWASEDKNFAIHHQVKKGDVFQMLNIPEGWHTNRLAIIENIEDQLVQIYYDLPSFQALLTQALERYHSSSEGFEMIRKLSSNYRADERQTIGAPIFFPKDSNLVRVLGTRKGKNLYFKAIIDLILHGAFSCDLSDDQEVAVDAATWCKRGHIYATHKVGLFYKTFTNVYRTAESLMIVFSADKFNEAQRIGQSRIEDEHSLNPVFYEGISKAEIKCIYMHANLRHDIDLLASDKSLLKVKDELNSGVFDQLSLKELNQLRRHLLIKEEHEGKSLSFVEKISYYDDDNPLTKEKVKSEFKFARRKNVYEESLKRLLARTILAEYLDLPPDTFEKNNAG